MKIDITQRKKLAISACKQVGELLLDNFGKNLKVQTKGDRDLVTDIDKKAEQLIIKLISTHFPQDAIVSEESPDLCADFNSSCTRGAEQGFRWIIDPIDGTHNFIRKLEIFGTSVAVEFKGEVVAGAIYMPCTDQLYSAQKGKGAYCNNSKITVSQRRIKQATLVYDSSIRYNKKEMLNGLGGLADKAFNLRMFGSTVRSLTYLAEGKVDAEIEFNDKVWDFAAGLLLVEEAGGRATDLQNEPWQTDSQGYVASNGVIHRDILKVIKRGKR